MFLEALVQGEKEDLVREHGNPCVGGWVWEAGLELVCCTPCLEQSGGKHGRMAGAAHCPPNSVPAALHWRGLSFPALSLLATGSSHQLGDKIIFLAAII